MPCAITEQAGSCTWLAATKNFQGATGTITFDENGDPVNKVAVILKFENGTSVYVKTIKP
jgi:branched-chain amino acid transport system substrate-binding protein